MKRVTLLTLLAFAGCAHQPITECGLSRTGSDWLSDADLQAAETAVLESAVRLGYDRDATCRVLSGTLVEALESPELFETETGLADGTTWCASQRMLVARSSRWQFSSLAHELFHIVTRCKGHDGWSDGVPSINSELIRIYFTAVPDEGATP